MRRGISYSENRKNDANAGMGRGEKNEREVKEDSESRNQRVKEKKLMRGECNVVKLGSCSAEMTAETRGHTRWTSKYTAEEVR